MPSASSLICAAAAVLGRRAAIQHRQRDARALRPFIARPALGCRRQPPMRLLDEIQTLVEPVAAEIDVGRVLPDRLDPVVGPDHVLAADRERAHPDQPRKVVDRAFDRESRLRRAVAAEAAGRDHVGVDRVADRLLVGAAIRRHRAAERRGERLAGMAAIGAGVGDDVNLDRGQRSVALGAELHPRGHLMARRRADELLLAGELPFHRAAGLERGEHAEILGDHLLLAAEAAADALGEDVKVARAQAEQVAELLLER